MLYSTIIFQLKTQQKSYLGLFCYDEVNASLQEISIKNLIHENIKTINNDFITKNNYIYINIITKYYDKPNIMDDIQYDIIIDHKNKKIYLNDTLYNYNDVFITNNDKTLPWEGNIYDDDELEYIVPEYQMIQTFSVPYYDYLDRNHENYGLKNIFDINDVEGYDDFDDYQKEEVQDRINQNIEYRNILQEYNNKKCFQDDFIKNKLNIILQFLI